MGDKYVANGWVCSVRGGHNKHLTDVQLVTTVVGGEQTSEFDRVSAWGDPSGKRGPRVSLENSDCFAGLHNSSRSRCLGQPIPVSGRRGALHAAHQHHQKDGRHDGDDGHDRERVDGSLRLGSDELKMLGPCRLTTSNPRTGSLEGRKSGASGVEQSNHDDQFPQGV